MDWIFVFCALLWLSQMLLHVASAPGTLAPAPLAKSKETQKNAAKLSNRNMDRTRQQASGCMKRHRKARWADQIQSRPRQTKSQKDIFICLCDVVCQARHMEPTRAKAAPEDRTTRNCLEVVRLGIEELQYALHLQTRGTPSTPIHLVAHRCQPTQLVLATSSLHHLDTVRHCLCSVRLRGTRSAPPWRAVLTLMDGTHASARLADHLSARVALPQTPHLVPTNLATTPQIHSITTRPWAPLTAAIRQDAIFARQPLAGVTLSQVEASIMIAAEFAQAPFLEILRRLVLSISEILPRSLTNLVYG